MTDEADISGGFQAIGELATAILAGLVVARGIEGAAAANSAASLPSAAGRQTRWGMGGCPAFFAPVPDDGLERRGHAETGGAPGQAKLCVERGHLGGLREVIEGCADAAGYPADEKAEHQQKTRGPLCIPARGCDYAERKQQHHPSDEFDPHGSTTSLSAIGSLRNGITAAAECAASIRSTNGAPAIGATKLLRLIAS